MTLPQPHGYPDFGRFVAQTDTELLNIPSESVNPSADHGPFFCAGYKYIALTMLPDTKSFQYQMIWSTDNGVTQVIDTDGAVAPQASANTIVFPVLGTWLTVRATPRTAPGLHGVRAYVVPSASSIINGDASRLTWNNGLFFNVNAATTTNFDFTNIYAGEVSVWTHCEASSGYVAIVVLDLAGNETPLGIGSDTGSGMPKDTNFVLKVPPRPIRVKCVNQSAANAQYGFALSGSPLWTGK